MQEVQNWLGHGNFATTDEYYGGILAETKKRTTSFMDTIMMNIHEETKTG